MRPVDFEYTSPTSLEEVVRSLSDGGDEATSDVRLWRVTQTLSDPEEHGDWVIEAEVDLDASDRVGEPVVLATALRRL